MKKLLFLFSICFILFSCSSDDNSTEKDPTLENTQWERLDDGMRMTFIFSSSQCEYIIRSETSNVSLNTDFDYFYKHPEVTLVPKKSDLATLKGIINNNKMTITNTSTNKEIGVYTKK